MKREYSPFHLKDSVVVWLVLSDAVVEIFYNTLHHWLENPLVSYVVGKAAVEVGLRDVESF